MVTLFANIRPHFFIRLGHTNSLITKALITTKN